VGELQVSLSTYRSSPWTEIPAYLVVGSMSGPRRRRSTRLPATALGSIAMPGANRNEAAYVHSRARRQEVRPHLLPAVPGLAGVAVRREVPRHDILLVILGRVTSDGSREEIHRPGSSNAGH